MRKAEKGLPAEGKSHAQFSVHNVAGNSDSPSVLEGNGAHEVGDVLR